MGLELKYLAHSIASQSKVTTVIGFPEESLFVTSSMNSILCGLTSNCLLLSTPSSGLI